MAFLILITSLR
uniref:Uncharacterized protein n=1 Tax=Arundo donax TaxID=35708 RepID=A0A0A9H4D2_ARUDO